MNVKDEKSSSEGESNERLPEKLRNVSFENLQKIKAKLGTKVYNNTIFGGIAKNEVRNPKLKKVKKIDKDRPLEMSSKKKVSRFMQILLAKKPAIRDPRFDRLCGEYNDKAFKKDYGFLQDVKKNDLKALRNELEATDNPEMISKIKYLIQRLENQLREVNRKNKREQMENVEKKERIEAVKKGEKPNVKKRSEKKFFDLVSQYEELKNTGKLKKHIQRLRKKKMVKDRKKLSKSNNFD